MNKYNLIDILSKKILIKELNDTREYTFDGIQIPMIQRDYAQGREEEGEIRKRFLKAIFVALRKEESLELDFVYGSIKEVDKKTFFIPLDGQQRITTLFLLYWYIGNQELKDDKLTQLRSNLERFTYVTRISAREFCEKLSKISISLKVKPRTELMNAAWFYDTYKKDPTVKAMLIMLDAIHEKYEEINKRLFPALSKLAFYILPLDGFNLSDELYIKMNARGKQLTDYENFKADLINWLQDNKNPFKEEFRNEVELNGRKMSYHVSFSLNLDNEWTDLFWEYTKVHDKSEDKIVDPYFMRFWNRYLLNYFIVHSDLAQEAVEREDLFQRFYGKEGNEESFKYESFDHYKTLFEKKDVIKNIQVTLDKLAIHYGEIEELIKPTWSIKDSWSLFDEKINQRQRILLLAVSLYLEKNEFNLDKFKNWIRVVWNIIIDPDIRSKSAMVNIMRIISKLSNGSADIYKFLIDDECLTLIQNEKSFAKAQLEEERQKAQLIISDISWENELIGVEKHPLFLGNIGFLLRGNPDKAKFKHRKGIASELFLAQGTKDEFNDKHLLIRASISQLGSWDDLYKLNLGDNADNWQLMLRRSQTVQSIICNFCDLSDSKEVLAELNNYVKAKSSINGWIDDTAIDARAKHIHEQLYQDSDLQSWMQNNGAVNLKLSNNYLYVHRPRSWYNWVALDTYRNQIATTLITQFNLTTKHKIGNADFYWGVKFELTRTYNDFIVSIEFDDRDNLLVGVKDDGKSNVKRNVSFNEADREPGWVYSKKYDYNEITSSKQIDQLVTKINVDVFDENNNNSLIYKILK